MRAEFKITVLRLKSGLLVWFWQGFVLGFFVLNISRVATDHRVLRFALFLF